ncbi:MAG: hypothetical protein IJ039_04730 [Clostridia bacterium]|nr:hypothetical protein [Clostridia bacterium]
MKKLFLIALTVFFLLALLGCDNTENPSGTSSSTANSTPDTTNSSNNDDKEDNNDNSDGNTEQDITFKVNLSLNGEAFTDFDISNPIIVNWNDGISFVDSKVNEKGYATALGLDGDYNVSLKNMPEGYTYNPNIYVATNDNPEITVDIYPIGTASGGGTSVYNRKVIKETSMYSVTLKSDSQKVYYEFKPKKSGTYTIESWVSTHDDKVNPKIDVYTSSFAAPNYLYTLDTGGKEGKNYTKNFKYEVEIAEEMISTSGGGQVVFIFAVHASARNDKYFPAQINFAVQYEGGFELNHTESDYMLPNEIYAIMADRLRELRSYTKEELIAKYPSFKNDSLAYYNLHDLTENNLNDALYLNAFLNKEENRLLYNFANQYLIRHFNHYYDLDKGKTWQNPAVTISGKVVLLDTNYRYNEKTGFYHKYDETKYTDTSEDGYGFGYGPILYADVSSATRTGILDEALINIEYRGNKALTVSNGTENYKLFVEGYNHAQSTSFITYGGYIELEEAYTNLKGYHDIANSDGAVPVTEEVRQFLQKYSVNQVMFMDGDGWAENGDIPYESSENSQWLFACGYYE